MRTRAVGGPAEVDAVGGAGTHGRRVVADHLQVTAAGQVPKGLGELEDRMRSDRFLRRAVPARQSGVRGRPPRHGREFVFGDPATWCTPDEQTVTETRLYGTAVARAWDRLHPRLGHRSAWTAQLGALPVIEGTVIRLQVEHLPSGATPKPVWLWWSGLDATETEVDLLWQAFLRRFDIERGTTRPRCGCCGLRRVRPQRVRRPCGRRGHRPGGRSRHALRVEPCPICPPPHGPRSAFLLREGCRSGSAGCGRPTGMPLPGRAANRPTTLSPAGRVRGAEQGAGHATRWRHPWTESRARLGGKESTGRRRVVERTFRRIGGV